MESPSHTQEIMYEKKTRAQRKRKTTVFSESEGYLSSDDQYIPPKDFECDSSDDQYIPPKGFECDSSDDSNRDIEENTNKLKKKARSNENRHLKYQKKRKSKRMVPLNTDSTGKSQATKQIIKKESETKVPVLLNKSRTIPFLGPNSIIGHWYIASGFVKDLATLLQSFSKLESWRFNAFATCWQKLKFSLIYRGRHSFKELLEFTEEICFWAKKFTSPTHNMKWRVGALYALYSLYHKHPLKHYKIRTVAAEYEHLESLARSFQNSAENPDPAYIFYKLKADGVFYFVATTDEMGLNFHSSERQQDLIDYEALWVLHEHTASNIFHEQERNIQKKLMEEYKNVKSHLWGKGSEAENAMSYVQPTILSEVDACLNGLHEDDLDVIQPPQSHIAPEANIGQKRGAIRDKAAAVNTTDDFLMRRQLQNPKKKFKTEQHSQESSTDSNSDNEALQDDHLINSSDSNKIKKLQEIMKCMEPSKKGNDISLKSKWLKKTQKPQEHLNENPGATTAGTTTDNLQNILMPNQSSKQIYDECLLPNSDKDNEIEHTSKYGKKVSRLKQNENTKNTGSSKSFQKVVGLKRKTEKTRCLSQKETKSFQNTSELRNFRKKATEKP